MFNRGQASIKMNEALCPRDRHCEREDTPKAVCRLDERSPLRGEDPVRR